MVAASVGTNDTPVRNGLFRGGACSNGVRGCVRGFEVGRKEFREEKRREETDLTCLYDILHGLIGLIIFIAPSSAYGIESYHIFQLDRSYRIACCENHMIQHLSSQLLLCTLQQRLQFILESICI